MCKNLKYCFPNGASYARVYFQSTQKTGWQNGKIATELNSRSYIVQSNNGARYRQNRIHIRSDSSTSSMHQQDMTCSTPMILILRIFWPPRAILRQVQCPPRRGMILCHPTELSNSVEDPLWFNDYVA